ncbi:MAG TPA: hypothetical protein VMZ53_30175 [Kofleriaceae bacterium]|nr:hypothetical protein [Kofleriaceae bacterium]
MRLTNHTAVAVLALVGCGVDAVDDSTATLRVEPADVSQVVTDGQPVSTQYRALLVTADGSERDVTAESTFALARPDLGTWQSSSLELRGAAVGPSAITATFEGMTASTNLTVYAHTRIVEEDVVNMPAWFDALRSDETCFPFVMYPEGGTILPSNLDGIDAQWADFANDRFEVSFATQYATVELYTRNHERALSADAWAQLASTHEPIMFHVSSLSSGSPTKVCTSQDRRLLVSDKPLTGAIYTWSDGGGIWRQDAATRGEPEPMIMPGTGNITQMQTAPLVTSCSGCAVSRSGARMALRLDSGIGTILDFTQDRVMQPTSWSSATFTRNADKLVIAQDGILKLIDETGGELATLVNTPNKTAMDPQFSPDGSKLVSVESSGFSSSGTGNLVVRTFMDDGNVFGNPAQLVGGGPGVANYSPSWSPDGKWLAYTRTSGWGTSSPLTSIWVIKTDGTEQPIQLVAPTSDVDMAARWAPGAHSLNGEAFYYLTFDSQREYGANDIGRQIWMMAFFPQTGFARPAFHVPFQSLETSNHVAQWADALVR